MPNQPSIMVPVRYMVKMFKGRLGDIDCAVELWRVAGVACSIWKLVPHECLSDWNEVGQYFSLKNGTVDK